MPSSDVRAGEPKPINKEYTEIIQSSTVVDKKFIEDAGLPAKIVYYCRDCKKMVKPKRIGKKFKFSCDSCNGESVAFGSEQSIRAYYKLKTDEAPKSK